MTNAAQSERAVRAAPARAGGSFGRPVSRAFAVARDRAVFETAALLLPIVLTGLFHARGALLWVMVAAYLCANVLLAARTPSRTVLRQTAAGWTPTRMILSVAMVAAGQVLTGASGLLAVVYVPIIALSAFAGRMVLWLSVLGSIGAHLAVETAVQGSFTSAWERTIGLAAAILLVAYATRREVVRMEQARRRMRRAVTVDRRRARQIAGIEAIGRILASRGPSPDALYELVGRISTEFGYPYVSIYVGDDRQVTLGAQRGYQGLASGFDGQRGIVGRVMRTQRPAFVPNVTEDPDYIAVNPDVTSEICVPLLADGAFLGFVNVEQTAANPLDSTDLRLMVTVADRLAAALIIGRDRLRLGERADIFRQLYDFSEAINGTLQPAELYEAIVRSVSGVVHADIATLHVVDRESGRYLLRAVNGSDHVELGTEARSGEGMAGRAIRDRTMIIDDAVPRPRSTRPGSVFLPENRVEGAMLAAAVPLVRDRAVLGVLTIMRGDRSERFSEPELDALRMLGEQSVLAVTNTFLHAEVNELAMRDALTGLFNRRYLDPALEQLIAQRSRVPAAERVPLAAIMFDLDFFSELNNKHGHHVGDEVLRAFGAILRGRMRSSDLVARYGGEEFVAILFRANLDDSVRIADAVRQELAATRIAGADGDVISATVSAGCAALSSDKESAEDLLRAADVALYMAKRAGRDRVCAA